MARCWRWPLVALVVGSVIEHWPTTFAPAGGMLMIGGWLLYSIHLLRR